MEADPAYIQYQQAQLEKKEEIITNRKESAKKIEQDMSTQK